MIRVFDSVDQIFSSNGNLILQPLKASVHKEDNGEYSLSIVTDLRYLDELSAGKILVADTPTGDQPFRIQNSEKTKNKLTVKAYHIFYDTQNYLIRDSYVDERTCNDALDHLNSATEPVSPFQTISDVTTVNSFRCVRKSLYEAVMTVVERWGGHLVRDGWQIGVRDSIGADNGVTVRYAKNLKDITVQEKWDDVVTKLLPVGKDGVLLNALDPSADLYVSSDIQYDIPYTKTVSFDQDINQEDYVDSDGDPDETAYITALVEDLAGKAQNYVNLHSVPEVNYTLSANLEKITDIGDTVVVEDSRLGLNLTTNVIAYDYDIILKRYTSVQFGNFKQTLGNLIDVVTARADQSASEAVEAVRVTLSDELKQATASIWNVLGNSYVMYDGDKILIVDSLPAETATNCMIINAGGIGFSNTGIHGTFNSAWSIDGTLNMQNINVINLVADMIKGGTLKLGSLENQSGVLELYDNDNNLIGLMNKDGLKMYGLDGSYVLMNNSVGFAGFDKNGQKIYWVSEDEFHMRKASVEDEITFLGKMRFIPITITENGTVVNDGIGMVSVLEA